MRHWFTADTHFGHANIIKYCTRPWLSSAELEMLNTGVQFKPSESTVKAHDDALIDNINSVVMPGDKLWVLGDFSFKAPGGKEAISQYADRIKCKNRALIWGNHDLPITSFFFKESHHLHHAEINGKSLVLCHYPLRTWNKSHHGSWHLFGHVHGNLTDIPHHLSLDVGVDTHNYKPWSWEEIEAYMTAKTPAWKAERDKWADKEKGGMTPGINNKFN